MKTQAATLGICKNARCNIEGNGPVEIYEGPGKYCPNCGELLQPYIPDRPQRWSDPAPAPEKLATPPVIGVPNTPPRRRWRLRRTLIGGSIVTIVAAAAVVVSHTVAGGRPSPAPVVGVCASSMTGRLARDVLGAYIAQNRGYADHFEIRENGCDVRFSTTFDMTRQGIGGNVLGHDGVVAIVNPQNPISELSFEQLRGVLTGSVLSWASMHGANKPIVVYLPENSTDEARIVSTAILHGAPVGSAVIRVPSSADAVRAVAAANGRNAIGMVAFSAAVPGKVLALHTFAAPSILSISEGRYPLALGVMVNAWRIRDGSVPGLLAYATSDGAKAVAARDGFVP